MGSRVGGTEGRGNWCADVKGDRASNSMSFSAWKPRKVELRHKARKKLNLTRMRRRSMPGAPVAFLAAHCSSSDNIFSSAMLCDLHYVELASEP